MSDKFFLEITPAGATFSIWGAIYTWQTAWLIYSLVLLGRKSSKGYLYIEPGVIPLETILCFIASEFANVTWIFLWDRQIMAAAFPVLLLISLTLYAALFFAHRNLYRITPTLTADNKKVDIWLVRFLVQNGIAFYATWCTIATLLNLGIVISYTSDPAIDQSVASTVSLSILTVEILSWFTLDIFFLDKYVRYNFSPYIVLVLALTGVVTKNYVPGKTNAIFAVVLLALASVAFVVKLFTMFWRHFKRPFQTGSITKISVES